MLTEEELRARMQGGLSAVLDQVVPRTDLLAHVRHRQRRRTNVIAGVAATGAVLGVVSPLAWRAVRQQAAAETSASAAERTTGDSIAADGLLVSVGDCAGLAVTFSLPGESPVPLFRLAPAPAVNRAAMNNNDLRYFQTSGPCRERVRFRPQGVLLQGANPSDADYTANADGIAGVISKGVLPGGKETVAVLLDCAGPGCPPPGTPLATLTIDVAPGTQQETFYPSAHAPAPNGASVPVVAGTGTRDGYPVNARGQTYGSAAGIGPSGIPPDLIGVYATNAKDGYMLRADYEARGAPRTAAEVRDWQQNGQRSRAIPVYDNDGTTVIGEFRFG